MTAYPALRLSVGYAAFYGWEPSALKSLIEGLPPALKAQLNYQAALYNATGRWARDLAERRYSYTTGDWTRDMVSAIESYISEAWLAGMAENGLTFEDMTPEWQAVLDGLIASEKDFLPDLAAWISTTVEMTKPLDAAWPAIHARLDMWANRWLDVFGQARSATAETDAKEEWVLGDADHCWVCRSLSGLVAYVWEWDEAGFRPQNPPNALLSMTRGNERGCGGYHCACERRPTNKRRAKNVLSRLLDLAVSGQV